MPTRSPPDPRAHPPTAEPEPARDDGRPEIGPVLEGIRVELDTLLGVDPTAEASTGDPEPNDAPPAEAALGGWLARARARHEGEASQEAMTRARRRRRRRRRRKAVLRALGWIVAGLALAAISAALSVMVF